MLPCCDGQIAANFCCWIIRQVDFFFFLFGLVIVMSLCRKLY
uniref:Uncharacterized protein n=1 Tax=Rhizophora mucronata TaxID=61149 RepID=A0A2P2R0Z0_RHIMU